MTAVIAFTDGIVGIRDKVPAIEIVGVTIAIVVTAVHRFVGIHPNIRDQIRMHINARVNDCHGNSLARESLAPDGRSFDRFEPPTGQQIPALQSFGVSP